LANVDSPLAIVIESVGIESPLREPGELQLLKQFSISEAAVAKERVFFFNAKYFVTNCYCILLRKKYRTLQSHMRLITS
jgi:hypothetical protein